MSLGCVVVNYRTPDDLSQFVESWMAQDLLSTRTELYVIDVDPVERWTHSWGSRLSSVAVSANIGYARACNLGARLLVNCDVLAFFNADVLLTPGALQACYDALMSEPAWGVLGPRQVDERGRLTAGGIVGTEAVPLHRGWMEPDRGQYVDVEFVPTVSGAAYFIKQRVWDELRRCDLYLAAAPDADGAFLPTQHYYEETYLSYHARSHSYEVVYFGPVTIVHKWHRASPVGGRVEREMPKAQEYFRRACDLHNIPHD